MNKKLFFSAAVLFCGVLQLTAALPEDAVVLEAEKMNFGKGWKILQTKGSPYASDGKTLSGSLKGNGTAAATVKIPADGTYRVWVRYLSERPRKKGRHLPFAISVRQQDNVKQKVMDSAPLKGVRFNVNFRLFVWDHIEMNLQKGDAEISFSKSGKDIGGCSPTRRQIDVLVITRDKKYVPHGTDLTPLYVKFIPSPAQKKPLALAFFIRKTDRVYVHQHVSLRTALVRQKTAPGKESKWFEISRYLQLTPPKGRYNVINFRAFENNRRDNTDADYELVFSTTPSDKGIIRRVKRSGKGSSISLEIAVGKKHIINTDMEESLKNLKKSQKAMKLARGKAPVKMPVFTGLSSGLISENAFSNEAQALKNIGFTCFPMPEKQAENMKKNGVSPYCRGPFLILNRNKTFKGGREALCYFSLNEQRINKDLSDFAQAVKKYPASSKPFVWCTWADEPETGYHAHIPKCPECKKRFALYLKENKVPLKDLGVSSYDDVIPDFKPSGKAVFYWSSRFGLYMGTEFMKNIHTLIKKHNRDWLVTINFNNAVRSSMSGAGWDWFDIMAQNALDCLQVEDYMGWFKSYQSRTWQAALQRSACSIKGQPFGPLTTYPNNTPWELQAANFAQLAQGSTFYHYFTYGPHYSPGSSPSSRNQWVFDSTAIFTYALGEMENEVLNSTTRKGDVALLFSLTSDIWNSHDYKANSGFRNLYGMERTFTYILLRHLQYNVDILSEDMLSERLDRYPVLVATGTHIRRAMIPVLEKWIRKGGVLYAGANALSFDEYGKPLGLLEKYGIKRKILRQDKSLNPGRPPYELRHRKPTDKVNTSTAFDALFLTGKITGASALISGNQNNAVLAERACGKGKIIASAILPAMSYIRYAKKVEKHLNSATVYPAGPREFMKKAIGKYALASVECNHPMLEASLKQGKDFHLLIAANWSGRDIDAQITLRGLPAVKKIKSVRSDIKVLKNVPGELKLSGKINTGDIIKIFH